MLPTKTMTINQQTWILECRMFCLALKPMQCSNATNRHSDNKHTLVAYSDSEYIVAINQLWINPHAKLMLQTHNEHFAKQTHSPQDHSQTSFIENLTVLTWSNVQTSMAQSQLLTFKAKPWYWKSVTSNTTYIPNVCIGLLNYRFLTQS